MRHYASPRQGDAPVGPTRSRHFASPLISRYVHKLVAERGKTEAVRTLHETANNLNGKNTRKLRSELLTQARELQCQ